MPAFTILGNYFKLLRIIRMVRTLRLLKLLNLIKAFRYSKTLKIIGSVAKIIVVASFAGFYILISALLVFNVEPDTFNTFFDAVYWATVSLTTVGYGDLYPVTPIGKAVSMVSSVFGIAIIALPASIITAGYMKALDEYVDEKKARNGRK
nr:potassium channel family protein [Fibrobacter sp. NR9]